MEVYDQLVEKLSQVDSAQLAVIIPTILILYFVPSIIAIFRNPNQLKLIAVANIPAGLSWIAWLALIGWAVSGKELPKRQPKT